MSTLRSTGITVELALQSATTKMGQVQILDKIVDNIQNYAVLTTSKCLRFTEKSATQIKEETTEECQQISVS